MITNPNTLGLFERDIEKIAQIMHDAGGLVYIDGANMNAILGITRPGDFGGDMMHYNVHKTFTGPHGAGGPGAGPIAVRDFLADYLPGPIVTRNPKSEIRNPKEAESTKSEIQKPGDGGDLEFRASDLKVPSDFGFRISDFDAATYSLTTPPRSIGRMRSFFGNVGILLRGYFYLRTLGAAGCRAVSEDAVLNANYLKAKLRDILPAMHGEHCMHEFVGSAKKLKDERGITAMDVAKRLLDYGFHAPTVYFPLVVPEAMMIEPTETESKATLDAFVEAIRTIVAEDPEFLHHSPHTTPVSRPDEVSAARKPVLKWG
jgi:glycine dehydrogenase subunit 2